MDQTLLQERYIAAAQTDDEFLAGYNAATVRVPKRVRVADFAQHADKTHTPKLLAARENPAVTGSVRVVVEWALRLLDARYDDFDMDGLEFQHGLASLMNSGIFTDEDVTDLLALGFDLVSQSFLDHSRATTQTDLNVLHLMPKAALVDTKLAQAEARAGVLRSAKAELAAGRDVILEGDA